MARLGEVRREILARAPEHDLVPSLDRIRAVCDLMGDPQRSFRVVHLTGTNGKTSTARMVERLLREYGLRTGRFTSPHLTDIRERISLDGELVSPERFVDTYQEISPYLDLVDAEALRAGGPRLTFFEVLVALGYACFADAPVDVAAVEVGMGGSWDATNVVDADVAVVTPIALDHQRFLGADVAAIAGEKAGIIKPGSVAVLAQQPVPAARVLMRRAAEVGATVAREGIEFGVLNRQVALGGQFLALQGLGGVYEEVFLPLYGEHQAHNAVCALAAVEAFLGAGAGPARANGTAPGSDGGPAAMLDPEIVRAAFADVDSPGRLEIVRRSPVVLVDAAHNPAGATALAAALGEAFTFTRLVGVVAVLGDKDAEGILAELDPVLDEVVVTRSSSPRSLAPEELAEIAVEVFGEDRVHVASRLDEAIDVASGLAEADGTPGGAVLITGSITTTGDARLLLGARS
jgi:dihydrofolate synthase/folylpolyglutamate synthase